MSDDPDHLLGRILASQARCERGQSETSKKLEGVSAELTELRTAHTSGRVIIMIGRWLVGIALGALAPSVGWIYTQHREADVRLTRAETQLVSASAELERHERIVEQTRNDIAGTRGDVRGVSATLDEVRETLRSVDDQLRRTRRR